MYGTVILNPLTASNVNKWRQCKFTGI